MAGKERIVLLTSLILNAALILVLIVTLINRPSETDSKNDTGAQVAAASVEPSAVPATQTAVIITVVARSTAAAPIIKISSPPTQTPIPTSEPSPTTAPSPTPQPTATEAVYTGPQWLQYLNQFRAQAGLPHLVEDSRLSEGAANHSYYMVANSSISHNEDSSLSGYTDSGLQAGRNGNIAVSGLAGVTYNWPIDYWVSAAFHIIPMLDPTIIYTGYGDYNDATSSFGMAATLDIKSSPHTDPSTIQYPIMFPRDGGKTWVTTYSLPEIPNSASGCGGYQKPTGAPIVLLLGNGENTPQVYESSLLENDIPIPHCVFDETNYYNPQPYWQEAGRTILNNHDAVVMLPRSPLNVGSAYTATIVNGGETIEWSFTVITHPLTIPSDN